MHFGSVGAQCVLVSIIRLWNAANAADLAEECVCEQQQQKQLVTAAVDLHKQTSRPGGGCAAVHPKT